VYNSGMTGMTDETNSTRLNKYLALQLGISRREADTMIEKGRVSVNGTIATLGSRFNPGDTVTVNGKSVTGETKYVYLAFHKPVGYVCSRKQQGDNPTIYDLIPKEYHTLKPVGRLDRDSSGLILLTNDGDFAYQMTHPKFHKMKIYEARLNKELAPLHQQMISDHGIQLEDGRSQFELERLSDDKRDQWRIYMSEGRNRQIRRTFTALGYTVTKLHRTQFGPYTLGTLKSKELALTSPL
jgi:23S rRNA pseudouridine2605 synthase